MQKFYSKDHEWIALIDGIYHVGLSNYAIEELGDITFVELPELDVFFEKGEAFAVIESVKAASDIYMPISGKIKAINNLLENEPEQLGEFAESSAWLCQLEDISEPELVELMTEEQYTNFINNG